MGVSCGCSDVVSLGVALSEGYEFLSGCLSRYCRFG